MRRGIAVTGALLITAAMLAGCGGGNDEQSEPAIEGKQACEYWTVAKTKTIEEIGDYLIAATEAAQGAAASDPSWDSFVSDLETIYPLTTAPPDDPSVLLTTSASLDEACVGYESWPGDVTASLPNTTEVLDPESSGQGGSEKEGGDSSSVAPISVEDLAVAFPTQDELSEAGGSEFTLGQSADLSFEGATYSEPRPGIENADLSDPGCGAVGVYSWRTTVDGDLVVGNEWLPALASTAWAEMDVFADDREIGSTTGVVGWSVEALLATPDSISEVLANAERAYPNCADVTVIDRGEEVPVVGAPPAMTESGHTVICWVYDFPELGYTFGELNILEAIGSVLLRTSIVFYGEPSNFLAPHVDLYNVKSSNVAAKQNFERQDLDVDFVLSNCQEPPVSVGEAEEADQYSSSPVVYVVETYKGGDVTLETASGGEQRTVDGGTTFIPQENFDPGDFLYVSVQNNVDRGTVWCEIYVDGERISLDASTDPFGIATCKGER